jgi:hypothetical protein
MLALSFHHVQSLSSIPSDSFKAFATVLRNADWDNYLILPTPPRCGPSEVISRGTDLWLYLFPFDQTQIGRLAVFRLCVLLVIASSSALTWNSNQYTNSP